MSRPANKVCPMMGARGSAGPRAIGNGQATALAFAREGATVAVVDQDLEAARRTARHEVADAAVFLASDEASYVTGVLLPVDGALSV